MSRCTAGYATSRPSRTRQLVRFAVELEVDNKDGALRAGGTAELFIPAEVVNAHRVSPSLLTLDDAGNVGIKIINESGAVEFIAADIALSSNDGVWIAGLPNTATIITVGQGFVTSGSVVEAIPESDIETSVAIKAELPRLTSDAGY